MSTGRCIFQGEFGEIRIPDLLTFLDMLGKTGTLELTRDDARKRIFWDRGEIVFADSTRPDEQVCAYLQRNGWVSAEAAAAARLKAGDAAPEDAVIKALIHEEALDPAVLIRGVKALVLEVVYSIFEWERGAFRFLLTEAPHEERVALRTSVSNVIMEGSRRLDEWRRIRESFPHDGVHPRQAPSVAAASVKLPGVEQRILEFVDGRSTVAEIIQRSGLDQFTTLGALLTLLNAGLITAEQAAVEPETRLDGLTDEERRAAEDMVDAFNAIFAGIHERVQVVKGPDGAKRYAATLDKPSFQRGEIFAGVHFSPEGRIPAGALLDNLGRLPRDQRIARLKGSLDRLLAQQVLQLDTSYPPEDKKAISDLIAREKARLPPTEAPRAAHG